MTGDYRQAQSGAASTVTRQAVLVSFGTRQLSLFRAQVRAASAVP